MSEDRSHRWFEPYVWALLGGFAIGAVHALAVRPDDEIFVTDSWSYVPADQWWLHGLVFGATIALVYGAVLLGYRIVALLLGAGVLFTVGGLLLVVAGAFFLGQAWRAEDGLGGTIAWSVMGIVVGGLGVPMIWAEQRARRRRS